MKILATGTEGFIGSVLSAALRERGHDLVGIDAGFYADAELYPQDGGATTARKDIRALSREDFVNVDAVVHLAELSNDPLGQLLPDITYEINHRGTVRMAELAKSAGVPRFVYASSCSVYGVADEDIVDETSQVNPQTAYAVCKTLVERDLRPLADDSFSPTFLRFATAYGASPRMRF